MGVAVLPLFPSPCATVSCSMNSLDERGSGLGVGRRSAGGAAVSIVGVPVTA